MSSRVLVLLSVVVLAAGCGGAADSGDGAAAVPRTVALPEEGVALAASGGQVWALLRTAAGEPEVIRVDGATAGAPVRVTGVSNWQPREHPVFAADDGFVWLAGEDGAYRVEPPYGAALPLRPGGPGALAWVSAIAVRGGHLYIVQNTVPTVTVINGGTGHRVDVPIPQRYAGARALGVDSAGWLYLGTAEGAPGKTAVVSPNGKLVAELDVVTSFLPNSDVAIPGKNTCDVYVSGKVVHSYPLGERQPTACLLGGDTAVGWSVESGGFSIARNTGVVDVGPVTTAISVVNPRGKTIASTETKAPRAVVVAANGMVWTLSSDGKEVRSRVS